MRTAISWCVCVFAWFAGVVPSTLKQVGLGRGRICATSNARSAAGRQRLATASSAFSADALVGRPSIINGGYTPPTPTPCFDARFHTDHLAGRHSIRTNQCSPPPFSPYFCTGRMPFLPPNQQRQSTESNHHCHIILSAIQTNTSLHSGDESLLSVPSTTANRDENGQMDV